MITAVTLFLLCVMPLFMMAQPAVPDASNPAKNNRVMVHIDHADQFSKKADSDVLRLIGHVRITHEDTHFFCDSAYFYEKRNSFEAYENVHININDSIDMYCCTMTYDGDRRFAEFFNEVKMMDDSTVLETSYMTYDRNQHLACYPDHAITTRGDKQLVSEYGYYQDDMKEFRFFRDVICTSPKYQMFTDTLYYNTRIEKMWFWGPTQIVNDTNTMEGEHGYYLTERDLVYLDKHPVMYNETQRLKADSLYYDRKHGFAKAMNSIDMIDTTYKVILRGEYSEVWEKKGFSFVTDSAQVIYYDKGDSLFISSDTMFYHFKTDFNDEEKIIGRRNVRFYKSDMQGKCDTMTYTMADSTLRMRHEPVLWADDAQMTADSIDIIIAHRSIDSVVQKNNAFIITKDTIEGYNQIKGEDMISSFRDGNLHHVNVTGSAKTISWLREDDTNLIGIKVSSSKAMKILMDVGSISRIKYFNDIEETLFPEKDLKENDRYLDGFIWLDEFRPKDRFDIFTSRSL